MPITAGILSIVAGFADLIVGLIAFALREREVERAPFRHAIIAVTGAAGVFWIILGIVAIIGGVFALQKKVWGLALVGAICALLWPSSILGILAIIFVALSKSEFK